MSSISQHNLQGLGIALLIIIGIVWRIILLVVHAQNRGAMKREQKLRDALQARSVPLTPLSDVNHHHFGVGADGELIEIDSVEPPNDLTDVSP